MPEQEWVAAFRRLAEEARSTLAPHPDLERLAAYYEGRLAAEQETALQEHLALCADCAESLLAMAPLDPSDAASRADDRPSDQVRAEWGAIRQRLAAEGLLPASPAPAHPHPVASTVSPRASTVSPFWRRAGFSYGLAASLAAVTIGLSVWVASLHGTIEELSRPRTRVPIVDLTPDGDPRRAPDIPPAPVQVPAGAERFVLILNTIDPGKYGAYEIEITDRHGQALWTGSHPRPGPDGTFTVEIPRRFLPAGRYRITVHGLEREGPRRTVARYLLELEYR